MPSPAQIKCSCVQHKLQRQMTWGAFPALPSSAKWCWPCYFTSFLSCETGIVIPLSHKVVERIKWQNVFIYFICLYCWEYYSCLIESIQSMIAAIINIISISINGGGSAVNHNSKAGYPTSQSFNKYLLTACPCVSTLLEVRHTTMNTVRLKLWQLQSAGEMVT